MSAGDFLSLYYNTASSLSLSHCTPGILCGSSSEKQLYYVTTPLVMNRDVTMDTVNVLVMGEVSSLYGFSGQKNAPTSFRHIDIGQFVWRKLT